MFICNFYFTMYFWDLVLLCISDCSQTHSNLPLVLVSHAVGMTKCVPFQALDSENWRQSWWGISAFSIPLSTISPSPTRPYVDIAALLCSSCQSCFCLLNLWSTFLVLSLKSQLYQACIPSSWSFIELTTDHTQHRVCPRMPTTFVYNKNICCPWRT